MLSLNENNKEDIMVTEIKALRLEIDKLAKLVKESTPFVGIIKIDSKEINESYDSLILGKAWLGKILGELGTNTPYINDGKRKDVEDIEPAADTSKNLTIDVDGGWQELNHIERVDWLRQEIDKIIKNILITNWNVNNGDLNELHLDLVYKYLCEARFWLGFELQRIKENKI